MFTANDYNGVVPPLHFLFLFSPSSAALYLLQKNDVLVVLKFWSTYTRETFYNAIYFFL
jgi:hypothetical protein